MTIQKIIISFILFFLFSTNWLYANDSFSDFEIKLYNILNTIIEKQNKEYWEFTTYENVLDFSWKVDKLKENSKIISLKKVLTRSTLEFEQKNFNKSKTIYVDTLYEPYTYFYNNKTYIYNTLDTNIETDTYSICDINNKSRCVEYKNTIFISTLNRDELPVTITKVEWIYYDNTWIYSKQINSYYQETNKFLENKESLVFYLNSLNYNSPEFLFWNEYTNIKDYRIYTSVKTQEEFLWIPTVKKISDINLNSFNNINKELLLDAIERDSRYLDNISKETLTALYHDVAKAKTFQDIYFNVKSKLSYDMDVYDYYLQAQKILPEKYYAFTWFWWYENNKAVCSWYVSLLESSLALKNYKDVIPEDWYYIDSTTWELIPHSWISINWLYYDITFDDGLNSKSDGKDIYYALTQELMYVERIPDADINRLKDVRAMKKQDRLDMVQNKYLELSKKSEYSNNILLQPHKILSENWVTSMTWLSLNKMWEKASNGYIFTITDWEIDFNVKDKHWQSYQITSVELVWITNLSQLTSYLQQNNMTTITLWVDNRWKFYLIKKILFR